MRVWGPASFRIAALSPTARILETIERHCLGGGLHRIFGPYLSVDENHARLGRRCAAGADADHNNNRVQPETLHSNSLLGNRLRVAIERVPGKHNRADLKRTLFGRDYGLVCGVTETSSDLNAANANPAAKMT